MPNQITHVTNKVTYRWSFNQEVTAGTFWDGSPYVIAANGLKVTNVEMITEHGTEGPNRVISDLELGFFGKPGFKGELYINGLMKNPKGMHDYAPNGTPRNKNYAFDSRSFGVFEKGWRSFKEIRDPVTKKRTKIPVPTNLDSSYPNFSLTKFMEMKSQMESGGVSIANGDVLVVQWSNFNPNASFTWDISRASGFPYQRLISRSCALSYGTLFVLNQAPAGVAFRPPVLWLEGRETTRPLHLISELTNLPDANTELVSNPWARGKVPDYRNDPSFKTFSYGMPFGGGTNYSQALPLYSGSIDGKISAYGAYYINPLLNRLQTLYSSEINALPGNQRLENLKTIVQWGIDAYGSIKSFASTASGAGQKPCAARPWSIIAGYFLNNNAMRRPETEMLADPDNRINGYFINRGEGLQDEDGNEETGTPLNSKMIELYGNPNDADNNKRTIARKRWLALQTALEAHCYLRISDTVGALTDYRTLGSTHRKTFSGMGANLQQTDPNTQYSFPGIQYKSGETFRGIFAKIQWNTIPAELNKPWAASHDGKAATFWYSYIKVLSGPGSGDTLYRIIKPWGDFRNAKPENETNATGYGFILDKAWQHGQPDQTSMFEIITCTEREAGELFYLIGPTRFKGMADANVSPTTPYAGICATPVTRLYGWMYYIEKLTGTNADLDKGSVLTHEYVQQILNKSPYNWVDYSAGKDYIGAYPWESAVLDKWYNRPTSREGKAAKIDWSTIPGISYWYGVTVAPYRIIPGNFNNDNIVDKQDIKMLVDHWISGENGTTYDLNNDGVVDINDLKKLINDYYGKS